MKELIKAIRRNSKNYQRGYYDGYNRNRVRTIRFIEDKIALLNGEGQQAWMLENLLRQIKEMN